MNDSAVQVCDQYPITAKYGITKMSCLQSIAGKAMNDSAVQVCDQYPTTSNKLLGTTKMSCLIEAVEEKTQERDQAYNSSPKDMTGIAIDFCRNEIPSHYKDDCIAAVASSRHIDARAFNLCKELDSHNQLECLSVIVDKTYHPSLIEECAAESYHNQIECLSKYGSPIDLQTDQAYNSSPKDMTGIAIDFCRNEIPSHYKDDCIAAVASSRHIDARAFNLCKELDSHNQLECLSVIVDKTYHPSLIEECAAESYHNQIECLSKYGSPIDLQKDQSTTVIIIQNGANIRNGLPDCKYKNFHGLYPEGGGCDFHGCWVAGGGCNFHGCWYPGGSCNFNNCFNEAPKDNICQ